MFVPREKDLLYHSGRIQADRIQTRNHSGLYHKGIHRGRTSIRHMGTDRNRTETTLHTKEQNRERTERTGTNYLEHQTGESSDTIRSKYQTGRENTGFTGKKPEKKSKKRTPEPAGTSIKLNTKKGYAVTACLKDLSKITGIPMKHIGIDMIAAGLKRTEELKKKYKEIEEEKKQILEQLKNV